MRILHLIHEAQHLLTLAHGISHAGFQEEALFHLAALRKLLNDNPEPQAGRTKPKGTNHDTKTPSNTHNRGV